MKITIGHSESKLINILQYVGLLFGIALIGFGGGFLSYPLIGGYHSIMFPHMPPSDAVSVANTYIVFTTIIFVGFTVVLAIAGIIFAHQASITKNIHLKQIADEFVVKIQSDGDTALQIVKELLKNEAAREAIDKTIRLKAEEIMDEICEQGGKNGTSSLKDIIDGGTF